MDNTQRQIYIDTTPDSEATYERLGEGVTSWAPSANSQIETKYFINSTKARVRKTSENKQWGLGLDRNDDDPANAFIYSMSEKDGDAAKTSIVIFDCKDGGKSPSYPAKKYNVFVDLTNDSNMEGGSDITMEATIYQDGDSIKGTFTMASKTFAPTGV